MLRYRDEKIERERKKERDSHATGSVSCLDFISLTKSNCQTESDATKPQSQSNYRKTHSHTLLSTNVINADWNADAVDRRWTLKLFFKVFCFFFFAIHFGFVRVINLQWQPNTYTNHVMKFSNNCSQREWKRQSLVLFTPWQKGVLVFVKCQKDYSFFVNSILKYYFAFSIEILGKWNL